MKDSSIPEYNAPSPLQLDSELVDAMSKEFYLDIASTYSLGVKILEDAAYWLCLYHLDTNQRDINDMQARTFLRRQAQQLGELAKTALTMWGE